MSCASDLVEVQEDTDVLVDAIARLRLHLNPAKTSAMVISRKKKPPVVSVCVGDQAIDVVQSVNYLGFIKSDLGPTHHHSLFQG